MSTGKKVAIGVGVGLGAAAVAAGAAYAMKKSNMSTKALFESSAAKEFSNISDSVKNQTSNANARDKALKTIIGNHAKPLDAVRAIRKNPLDSARVMSDMDWNRIKPYLDSSTPEYNFVLNTMQYFGKFK